MKFSKFADFTLKYLNLFHQIIKILIITKLYEKIFYLNNK